MSNRIDHIIVLHNSNFRIPKERFDRLALRLQEDLPEGHLFNYQHVEKEGFVYPERPYWHGEGSAYTTDILFGDILPECEGSLDFIMVFESGDFEGYRFRNGTVTRHKVVQALGDPIV